MTNELWSFRTLFRLHGIAANTAQESYGKATTPEQKQSMLSALLSNLVKQDRLGVDGYFDPHGKPTQK